MALGEPDRKSRFVQERDGSWSWRQVLDWLDAHIVDHGGFLWIGQPGGGYRVTFCDPVFYDLSELFD